MLKVRYYFSHEGATSKSSTTGATIFGASPISAAAPLQPTLTKLTDRIMTPPPSTTAQSHKEFGMTNSIQDNSNLGNLRWTSSQQAQSDQQQNASAFNPNNRGPSPGGDISTSFGAFNAISSGDKAFGNPSSGPKNQPMNPFTGIGFDGNFIG